MAERSRFFSARRKFVFLTISVGLSLAPALALNADEDPAAQAAEEADAAWETRQDEDLEMDRGMPGPTIDELATVGAEPPAGEPLIDDKTVDAAPPDGTPPQEDLEAEKGDAPPDGTPLPLDTDDDSIVP